MSDERPFALFAKSAQLPDERGQIANLDSPFTHVPLDYPASEADLDRAVAELGAAYGALGIPLDDHGCVATPLFRQSRAGQSLLPARPGDPNTEHMLLPFLRRPPASLHHSEERRFGPRHATDGERGDEPLRRDRRLRYFRAVRLIDDDGARVVIGPDLEMRRGQAVRIIQPGSRHAPSAGPGREDRRENRHSGLTPKMPTGTGSASIGCSDDGVHLDAPAGGGGVADSGRAAVAALARGP